MVNKLISGISVKLNTAFGDGYHIYQNDVEQGLKEPCFLIALLEPSRHQQLGARYRLETPFDIHYFPRKSGDNGELIAMADALFDILEVITLSDGGLIRGVDMRFSIADCVLHFFVRYNLFLSRSTELPNMEDLTLTNGIWKE